jgi:hypothetical protein
LTGLELTGVIMAARLFPQALPEGSDIDLKRVALWYRTLPVAGESFGRLELMKFRQVVLHGTRDLVIENLDNGWISWVRCPAEEGVFGLVVSVPDTGPYSLKFSGKSLCVKGISRFRPSTSPEEHDSLGPCP